MERVLPLFVWEVGNYAIHPESHAINIDSHAISGESYAINIESCAITCSTALGRVHVLLIDDDF
ncbi:hypothetical protein KH172YL63_09570 [Bacillus sp. KH172YL63]|nr:hypothetical protein KH172YL63_09570 [Bacillus sp. KH172YL63]